MEDLDEGGQGGDATLTSDDGEDDIDEDEPSG